MNDLTENLATSDNSRNCEEPPKLPLAFTVITGIQPARLTKIIGLNAKGGMRKETSAMLSRGQAQRVGVADLNDLKSHLDTLTSAQAVTWGVTKDDAVEVCTQGDTEAQQAGAIARSETAPKAAARRARVDSVEAVVAVLRPRAAIQPPKHMRLRPADVAYWNSILTGRARDEWRACDLVLAMQLARTQADLAAESERLGVEGMVIASAKADGNPITNPRATICDMLAKREMALMRTLRMGGIAAGRQSALLPGRSLEREADAMRATLERDGPGGLLAH